MCRARRRPLTDGINYTQQQQQQQTRYMQKRKEERGDGGRRRVAAQHGPNLISSASFSIHIAAPYNISGEI